MKNLYSIALVRQNRQSTYQRRTVAVGTQYSALGIGTEPVHSARYALNVSINIIICLILVEIGNKIGFCGAALDAWYEQFKDN